jgi:hypothetical protein
MSERAAFGPTSFVLPPDKYSVSLRKRDSESEIKDHKPNQRAEILRIVNSGKTSAAEAARLFGLHRSSVSRLLSLAHAGMANVVGLLGL